PLAVAAGSAVGGQFSRKWFDDFEDLGDLALVISKHDALAQYIGDGEKSPRRHFPPLDRPPRRNLILRLAGQFDGRCLLLEGRQFASDPWLKFIQEAALIFCRQANQNRDTI